MVRTCNKQTSFEVCSNSDKSYWAIGPDLSDSNSIIRTEERGLSFIPVVGWRYNDESNWISNPYPQTQEGYATDAIEKSKSKQR